MLIWIKAHLVAIGVLVTCVLLLSPVVSEQVELNQTAKETQLSDSNDYQSVLLMSLPFASALSNPCSWEAPFRRQSHLYPEGYRAKFMHEFFTVVSHNAKVNKEDTLVILQNLTITGCSSLHINNLPNTPTLEELKAVNMEDALNKLYLSLLVHSAYSYFIHYQFVTSTLKCSRAIQGEQSLANQSLNLAYKSKAMACYVRVGMLVLDFDQDNVLPLLNETLSDLSQCSRRAIRDCQVMKSMYNLLDSMSEYASKKAIASSGL